MTTILIIDDDLACRKAHRHLINQEGYDIFEASDGKEAIGLCKNLPMDIVITDLFMPEKEGIETIIELRRDFPKVKIIVVSGGSKKKSGLSTTLHMAKKLGAQFTFIKPVNKLELVSAIQKLLET